MVDSGTTRLRDASRSCNQSKTVTVGPSGYCRIQGYGICVAAASCEDISRRSSSIATRAFSIDYSGDSITRIVARTSANGEIIPDVMGTSDRDPCFQFSVDASGKYSAISCCSWAIDDQLACETCDLSGGDSGSIQLAEDTLSTGIHEFNVRAVDIAGNCGPVSTFVIVLHEKGPDINFDGDVDGLDLARLTQEYGSSGCDADCASDYDEDGFVNEDALLTFAEEFGRTDCP